MRRKGDKYMLSDDQQKRNLSPEAADRQFDKIWDSIAADQTFRRGGDDFFGLMKRRGLMTSAEIADWHAAHQNADDQVPELVPEPDKHNAPLSWPPGLVGEIATYILNSSRMPVPSYAIAGALTVVSYLIRNFGYVAPSDTGLNLYQVLIGGTGKGKEDPARLSNESWLR